MQGDSAARKYDTAKLTDRELDDELVRRPGKSAGYIAALRAERERRSAASGHGSDTNQSRVCAQEFDLDYDPVGVVTATCELPAGHEGAHALSDRPVGDAARFARLERAVETMAWWLVEAQTGFGTKDAEGIVAILRGER